MQPPHDDWQAPLPPVPSGEAMSSTPLVGAPAGQAPQIRFEAIGEAWQLFQQQMATWVLATLLYFVIVGLPALLCVGPFYYKILTDSRAFDNDPGALLGFMIPMYAGLFLFVIPLSFVLMGGLYRMALKQLRGETIGVGDLFDIGDVFGALLGTMFLVMLAVLAATLLGCILCGLPGFVVSALLMLAVPAVVDRRIGSGEALQLSWNALKPHWLMATVFYFVISLIGQIGAAACYIGLLFTFPLFILGIAILYRDFLGRAELPLIASPR